MRRLERQIVFLHVPKAGGTTVRHHLKAWFPDARHVQFTSPEHWDQMSDREVGEHDVFTGHIGFRFINRVRDPILVSCLRDPLERAISQFYYHKHNLGTFGEAPVTFRDYLLNPLSGFRAVLDNGIVWQFAWDQYPAYRDRSRFPTDTVLCEAALGNVAQVGFIAFQESLNADLLRLARYLGLGDDAPTLPPANTTRDKPGLLTIPEKDQALFEQMAALDIEFVRCVRATQVR